MLYALAVIMISLFLPWWSASFSSDLSYGGQSFGSSTSNSLSGYQLTGGILPILVIVASVYFIFNNTAKYVLWSGVGLLLYASSTYFGIIPTGMNNVSFSSSIGGVSAQSSFTYGLYVFSLGSAILIFLAYRESNGPVTEEDTDSVTNINQTSNDSKN